MNEHRGERGQALVLIIFSVVALMGFAALGVDAGRVYMERRRAQSAADAAAFAAALAAGRGETDWQTPAMDQLKDNGYDDPDSGVNDDQRMDVQLYNPPIDADTGNYDDPNDYYQVIIRDSVDQIFSQFVYKGGMGFTVEAVSHSRPITEIFPNGAFVATSKTECDALKFHGNQGITVNGGSIISNSDERATSCSSAGQDGGNTINVNGGGIYTAGRFDYGTGTINSGEGVNENMGSADMPTLPVPDCSGLLTQTYTGQASIQPGVYPGGIKVTGAKTVLTLASGMYCLDDDFSMNGGKITGNQVLIVMRHGNFDISGGTIARLSQNQTLKDASGQKWGGMLLFMPMDNDGYIYMSGNTGTHYTGTIYAPGPRTPSSQTKCKIEGTTSAIALNSAVICYSIDVGGTAGVTVYYRQQQNYRLPPSLDLNK